MKKPWNRVAFLLWVGAASWVGIAAGEPKAAAAPKLTATQRSNSTSAPSLGAVLSRLLEERARASLERIIPARNFEVTVTVTPSRKAPPAAPYDPKGVSTAAFQSMAPEEMDLYVGKITVEVWISQTLEASRSKIEALLNKALKMNKERGDAVSFSSLGIQIAPEFWEKEKTDLKQEMARLKSENDKLGRDLQVAKSAMAAQQAVKEIKDSEKPAPAPLPPPPADTFWKDTWKENQKTIMIAAAVLIGAFVLVSFALILMGRSMANAGKNLGGALGSIAAAMESVGGSLSANMALPVGDGDPSRKYDTLEAKMIAENRGGIASLPIESIHSHLMKVRQELLDNLNDSTEAIILRHLTQLCTTPNTVGRAVVAMELLGRDMATQLFRKLGVAAQEAVMRFMREGIYDRSKMELMLEAGEELKTKLLADSFDKVRGASSEKVAERILQLGDDDLVQVCNDLDPDMLPRLFIYLEAPKISALLAMLKRTDPNRFEKAMAVLKNMPDAETLAHYDEDIMRALEAVIDKTKADAQRPFLKVYQDIVEASEDELGEEIVRQLSNDPRLDSYFKENVITINTVFLLPKEIRHEIIEALNNKDISALAFGVKEDQRTLIFGALGERRRVLVHEELDSLSAKGNRQAQAQFKRVKEVVLRKLREMKADGSLAHALGEGEKKVA